MPAWTAVSAAQAETGLPVWRAGLEKGPLPTDAAEDFASQTDVGPEESVPQHYQARGFKPVGSAEHHGPAKGETSGLKVVGV